MPPARPKNVGLKFGRLEPGRPAARGARLSYLDASGVAIPREQNRRREKARQGRPGRPERSERGESQVPGYEEQ